jgi:Arylsulfotransferase (ASST)
MLLPLLVLAALPGAAGAGRVARPPGLVRLTSTPVLYPAYSPAIHDYVVRCDPAKPTHFTTWAAAGTTPSIDGRTGRTASVALKPGQAVTVAGSNAAGTTAYHVRCLPSDFPTWTDTRTGSTNDWYLITPTLTFKPPYGHYLAIFDGNGVPVWWYRAPQAPLDPKLVPGPAIAFASFPVDSHAAYQIRRLDGKLVRKIVSPDGLIDDHELQRDAKGDVYFLVYRPKPHVDLTSVGGPADGTVLETEIEELSPSGKLIWTWSSDGHVALSESSRWIPSILKTPASIPGGGTGYDFFHANALALGKGYLLLSMRQTDAIYAIDRANGQILWKLGGTKTPQSLTVLNDSHAAQPLGGQHDVRLLTDGSVSAFDDATNLPRPPRAVRYAIDTTARTATLLQQVTDPAVTSSVCCGSARRVENGDWVISWGGDPVVAEYRPDGTTVFKLTFDGLFSYRVDPVAHRRLSIEALRAGMDAMAPPLR